MYKFSSFKKVAAKARNMALTAYVVAAATVVPAMAANTFGLDKNTGGTAKGLQITQGTTLIESVQNILNSVFWLLGIVAVVMIIWEGITVITSKENKEKLEKAQKYLINAAIGFAMILLSAVIVNFIIDLANTGSTNEATQFQTQQQR